MPHDPPSLDDAPDRLVTTAEAAAILRLAPRALESRRRNGKPPKFVALSARCVRYRLADLRDEVERCTRGENS